MSQSYFDRCDDVTKQQLIDEWVQKKIDEEKKEEENARKSN